MISVVLTTAVPAKGQNIVKNKWWIQSFKNQLIQWNQLLPFKSHCAALFCKASQPALSHSTHASTPADPKNTSLPKHKMHLQRIARCSFMRQRQGKNFRLCDITLSCITRAIKYNISSNKCSYPGLWMRQGYYLGQWEHGHIVECLLLANYGTGGGGGGKCINEFTLSHLFVMLIIQSGWTKIELNEI